MVYQNSGILFPLASLVDNLSFKVMCLFLFLFWHLLFSLVSAGAWNNNKYLWILVVRLLTYYWPVLIVNFGWKDSMDVDFLKLTRQVFWTKDDALPFFMQYRTVWFRTNKTSEILTCLEKKKKKKKEESFSYFSFPFRFIRLQNDDKV